MKQLVPLLLVVAVTVPALRDPPWWDANVVVHQGQYVAEHGLDFSAYREFPDVLKPPVFAGVVLGTLAKIDPGQLGPHLASLVFALLALWAAWALARALGGSEEGGLLAMGLLALSPLFVAQAGLVQTDLPATALAAWAWVLLLRGRTIGWLVVAALAVLAKESAYFLWAPALALGWMKHRRERLVRTLALAAWPGIVLCGWLFARQALTGSILPKLNRDALGANFILDTAIHEFLEGGRIALVALAALALRSRSEWLRARRPELIATVVGVVALPLLFPAPLPRYMLPGLPWMCALAAIGLAELPAKRRWLVGGAVAVFLLSGWIGPSWHANGGHHLDSNLQYRRVLATHAEAVRAVAAEKPRAVVAAFPLVFGFSRPASEGWLAAPIHGILAGDGTPDEELCRGDFLAESDQSAPMGNVPERLKPHLKPWRSFGRPGFEVRVSRIDCAP